MLKILFLLGILIAGITQINGSSQYASPNGGTTSCSHASLMLIFLLMFIGFLGVHIGIVYLITQKFTGDQDKKKKGKK